MGRLLRTRRAEEDLLGIWEYVANDSPQAADRLLDEIGAKCDLLAETPQAGRLRGELSPGLRSFPVGNYVVYYRPCGDGIIVIRVLHGARDVDELL